jgi:hypothetical protein
VLLHEEKTLLAKSVVESVGGVLADGSGVDCALAALDGRFFAFL